MIFFADIIMYKTKKIESNHAGHISTSYTKLEDAYYVNIQPIDEKAIKYTWGSDIKSNSSMYSEVDLKVGDIVVINDKAYAIEKKIAYRFYFFYRQRIFFFSLLLLSLK